MIQQNRLITPSGKSQRMSYDQSAVKLQSETLIIHGTKPILKKQRLLQIKVFTPNQITASANDMQEVNKMLGETVQSNTPLKRICKNKIKTIIFALKEGKSAGYDLIRGTLLKNLPEKRFIFLTFLYNAIFRLCFILQQWKVGKIKMILKPGKRFEVVKSYRPIYFR